MTPAAMQAAYARQIGKGETIALEAIVRDGRPAATVLVRARVTGYRPEELVDDVQQGDRRVVMLAADLVAAGFPVPPLDNDRLTVRGTVMNIETVDGETRSVGGVTIAFEIRARGG